ncbi:MbcA/ParS/Xre antitoxin family protein [Photobacterium sp. ZSDE20]|uniref:MbcA/ParS/Xre antitoxin family protein n=1 Tax=Photobacterium pectinilyticum TaxID=2906793 RepID=A0ABT1N4C4_9GAMM|nr:MbcA/ParS/Xre antitoxin family protein [Photobacterium sp. ZSDE20]MCQ1059560.1 MbcA/ParS/Xre antitoxin family protein [Photobacterium sp. ZSDE20]MDD1825423.1 MbcA/ParS/Xre antitoxin family protein [Photobacterium sp. ZSDE20]
MNIKHINHHISEMILDLFDGDMDMAEEWLCTPKCFLNNETPLDALTTSGGANRVVEAIQRIKRGDFS